MMAGPEPGSTPQDMLRQLISQASLPADNLEMVAREVGARREQVQALRAQLGLLDEQLAALEQMLVPLLAWSRTWAGVQRGFLGPFGDIDGLS
jgi:hypothetical protein